MWTMHAPLPSGIPRRKLRHERVLRALPREQRRERHVRVRRQHAQLEHGAYADGESARLSAGACL